MWGTMSKLRVFTSNEDGNFAIMFGIAAAMITVGMAMAIDLGGMHKARAELQNSLDSAALAAVVELSLADNEINNQHDHNDVVLEFLAANGYDLRGAIPSVYTESGALFAEVTVPYKLQFGGVLNKPSVDISAVSKVALPSGGAPVEIALILDNTESMNRNGKMGALRQGAYDFIDAIEESDSGSKIAIVPFARYVDVGTDKRNEPWLEVPAEFDTDRTWEQATHTGGTCETVTESVYDDGFLVSRDREVCTGQTTTYETQHRVIESRWIGCVGVRSDGLHLEDGPYTTSATRIQGLLHKLPSEVTGLNWDTESWCPRKVTPLTDDYELLRTEISSLYGTDRTYIPMGLSWGRRILSPEAPFTETDTVNPKRKIMILMSDGQNTAHLDTSHGSRNALTDPPYIREIFPDEQADGVIAVQANADTAALCELVKEDGTEMYTIAFQVDNQLTLDLLQNCASSSEHYFDSDSNNALVETFTKISNNIGGEIRLMQ